MIFPGLLHPLTLFKVRMLSLDRRYSPNLNAEQDPNDSSKERHDFIAQLDSMERYRDRAK